MFMDFISVLLQKKADYEKEMLFAKAKIEVVDDLINAYGNEVAVEAKAEELVDENAEHPTDTMY